MTFKVQFRQCATCIYRPDSPLDLAGLEAAIADPYGGFKGFRICHHSHEACCRGFWDRHKDKFALGQIAQRLDAIEFVCHDNQYLVTNPPQRRSEIRRTAMKSSKKVQSKSQVKRVKIQREARRTDQPAVESPAVESPAVESPAVESPVVEQPSDIQSAAEQPVLVPDVQSEPDVQPDDPAPQISASDDEKVLASDAPNAVDLHQNSGAADRTATHNQGDTKMTATLTYKGLSKSGKFALYSGLRTVTRLSITDFPNQQPVPSFTVEGEFAGPREKKAPLTAEERKAARAAKPKLTLAEKAAKLREKLAKLEAAAAAEPQPVGV